MRRVLRWAVFAVTAVLALTCVPMQLSYSPPPGGGGEWVIGSGRVAYVDLPELRQQLRPFEQAGWELNFKSFRPSRRILPFILQSDGPPPSTVVSVSTPLPAVLFIAATVWLIRVRRGSGRCALCVGGLTDRAGGFCPACGQKLA